MNKSEAIEAVKLLRTLSKIRTASHIQDGFVNTFIEKHIIDETGQALLHGNFNLGGTISGRLSSSNPNLQNQVSKGEYAKLIKQCFRYSDDWVFCGADFTSLEDKISALTTKDPNKIKVYADGYDGHCLRAYSYYKLQMSNIINTVESINSIEQLYPKLRSDSKNPTFALTYQGTWYTLVNNIGLPKIEAKRIELEYHELYQVSDQWVQDRLTEAAKQGYVDVAFGLRLRTPILKEAVLNSKYTPYIAKKAGRTAGNAMGQSYGLLNNRAAIEFQERLWDSPYVLDIKPVAHIHDAQYFMTKRDPDVLHWLNTNLIECMQWQELPELKHDIVKLGGSLELFYPSWNESHEIPNKASLQDIQQTMTKIGLI